MVEQDQQPQKLFGVNHHAVATSAEQSMFRPCLLFRNGHKPQWVDLTRYYQVNASYPIDARYAKNRYLTGVSVTLVNAGEYWVSGYKFYLGTLIAPGIILPVPSRAEDLITGPLSYCPSWFGKVPAPYGFAVFSHTIGSGSTIHVSAMLEDM